MYWAMGRSPGQGASGPGYEAKNHSELEELVEILWDHCINGMISEFSDTEISEFFRRECENDKSTRTSSRRKTVKPKLSSREVSRALVSRDFKEANFGVLLVLYSYSYPTAQTYR